MIECPRYLGLVKHDGWHFDGGPANEYAMGAYAHATANLLQLGMMARTAWTLGQYGIEPAPRSTEDTLADYLKIQKQALYEQETVLAH